MRFMQLFPLFSAVPGRSAGSSGAAAANPQRRVEIPTARDDVSPAVAYGAPREYQRRILQSPLGMP